MWFALLLTAQTTGARQPALEGPWRASLETPGGALEFGLEFARPTPQTLMAFLVNGEERIEVRDVRLDGTSLVIEMPHYDSRIRATLTEMHLVGTWEKRRSAATTASVPFQAHTPGCENPGPIDERILGRWLVDFATDDHDAVAVFQAHAQLRGTFLTSTGDYRYLAGYTLDSGLTLSCFDGAHAFLFKAKLQPDGTLAGDFWSGNWHHETWTAKRDDTAALADPFAQTKWNGATQLAELAFPDLDGKKRTFREFAGQPALLVVFGSWCPNCNDEAALLKRLDERYRSRGLRILGLAFELTGEFARDAEQVRIFAARHALSIPFFLCGTADKDEATRALGLVDRVRAFPTTIFVGTDGLPKAIHSGFAGPATGAEHEKLVAEFEARIEALLPAPSPR
jgi:thiol-disulfide isomerase/thioredoxin